MWNLPDCNPGIGRAILQCFVASSLNSIFHTARVVRSVLISWIINILVSLSPDT